MFKELSYYQSFSNGSDFWILFFDPDDFWFKKINWKTQFLLQPIHSSKSIKTPLLVQINGLSSPQSILCLPKSDSWIQEIYKSWTKLNKPSLRVFLTKEQSKKDLEYHWPKEDLTSYLSCLKGRGENEK